MPQYVIKFKPTMSTFCYYNSSTGTNQVHVIV